MQIDRLESSMNPPRFIVSKDGTSLYCERSRQFRFKSLQYLFSLLLQPTTPTPRLLNFSKRLGEKQNCNQMLQMPMSRHKPHLSTQTDIPFIFEVSSSYSFPSEGNRALKSSRYRKDDYNLLVESVLVFRV